MSESIYRFYGSRDFDLDSLAGSYLWFSRVEDFNDPFEGMYREQLDIGGGASGSKVQLFDECLKIFNLDGILKEYGFIATNDVKGNLELVKLFSDSVIDSINNEIARFSKYRHCSFAMNGVNPLSLALESKLLWSHYANGMRGFAIEFDSEEVASSLVGSVGDDKMVARIHYEPLIKEDIFSRLLSGDLFKANKSDDTIVKKVLTTKCPEWAYENELRLLHVNQQVSYDPQSIRSIILGCKMSKARRETIIRIVSSLDLTPSKVIQFATVDPNTFQVKLVVYDDFVKMESSRSAVVGQCLCPAE